MAEISTKDNKDKLFKLIMLEDYLEAQFSVLEQVALYE